MSVNPKTFIPLNRLQIATPEGVAFSIQLAGPAVRFLAWGIDVLVTIVALMFVAYIGSFLGSISEDLASALLILAYFVLHVGYSITLEWYWHGQTLGKFVLGLRVMDANALPLTFSQVVLRNLLRFVDSVPALYLVGGITMALGKKNQRLGDIAANTVVASRRAFPMPNTSQVQKEKYNSFRAYPHLEARLRQRITPEEAALAVRALLRKSSLEPEARLKLYHDLAEIFRARVTFPEEATSGLTDEQYLRNVVECLFSTRSRRSVGAQNTQS